jgi:hypothetical protein
MSCPRLQSGETMQATVWKSVSGVKAYGLRVLLDDRNRYFKRMWREVEIEIDGIVHRFEIGAAFWSSRSVIRDDDKGSLKRWLVHHRSLAWARYEPTSVTLEPVVDERFRLVE